ncbi:MAG: AtpZ/AtpI family protein [Alphaproteobacteria bacterium]
MSHQFSMTERKPQDSRKDLDERLARFRSEQDVAAGRTDKPGSSQGGLGFAMRIGTELVAALVIGVGFGLLLDNWLNTKPWFMLVFFLLGAAAGMFNVYRVVQNQGGAIGYKPAERRSSEDTKTDRDGE